MTTNKYTYDYYNVELPEDVTDETDNRHSLAIDIAREMSRLYVIPCVWYVVSDNGQIVRVARKRYNTKGPIKLTTITTHL